MERLKKILHELMEEMKINETIKLKITPMKQKVASLSFKTKILRLNRKAVEVLNDEEIRYILTHELIHFKIKDVNHGSLFLHELEKYYSFEEAYNFEIEVIGKLIEGCYRRNRKLRLLKEYNE
jgi:predicted metal-dependent hydrolase